MKNYTTNDMDDPEKALNLLERVVSNYKKEPKLMRYDEFRNDAELALHVADIMGLDRDSFVFIDERTKDRIERLCLDVEKYIRPAFLGI